MAGFENFCQKIICMQTIVEISYLSLSALIRQVIESFGKMRKKSSHKNSSSPDNEELVTLLKKISENNYDKFGLKG